MLKKKGERKEKFTELQKPNKGTFYKNNKKKCDLRGKKKKKQLQNLIGFLSANKIDNYNGEVGVEGEGKIK